MKATFFLFIAFVLACFFANGCNRSDLGSLGGSDVSASPTEITLVAGGPGVPVRFTLQVNEDTTMDIAADTSASGNPADLRVGYGCSGGCLRHTNDYVVDTIFAPAGTAAATYNLRMNLYYLENHSGRSVLHQVDDVTLTVHVQSSGDILFTDTAYDRLGWELLQLKDNTWSGVTWTLSKVFSGGNPGSCQNLKVFWTSKAHTDTGYFVSLMREAHYDPSVSGAVRSIAYSWDDRTTKESSGGLPTLYCCIVQNGKTFISAGNSPDTTWKHESLFQSGLTPSSFTDDLNLGAGNQPDFSSTGSTMRLGIVVKIPLETIITYHEFTLNTDNWVLKLSR